MADAKTILADAIELGVANFVATRGAVPDSFKLLLEHAPAAFAGYGMIRSDLMKDCALDLKTKELIFALLDTVIGASEGAKVHAANAVRLGLTVEQLSEGLVQCILAAGITTWNITGRATLEHAIKVRDEIAAGKP
jgi:alkylhydroperoxidase/carboxymuconolactone decarboxylase family protein YurZ